MKYIILSIVTVCYIQTSLSQKTKAEVLDLRQEHLSMLTDSTTKMLTPEEINEFQGLDYFDFDTNFQVEGIIKKNKGKQFEMTTSTDRKPMYRRYGYFYFTIDSIQCKLEVYQNISLLKNPEYKNYLFIPFKDGTTALTTYGAGRFLEVEKTKGRKLLIDFNLAFNPYCSYSERYSCPIPPRCNTLDVDINAGEKTPLGH